MACGKSQQKSSRTTERHRKHQIEKSSSENDARGNNVQDEEIFKVNNNPYYGGDRSTEPNVHIVKCSDNQYYDHSNRNQKRQIRGIISLNLNEF